MDAHPRKRRKIEAHSSLQELPSVLRAIVFLDASCRFFLLRACCRGFRKECESLWLNNDVPETPVAAVASSVETLMYVMDLGKYGPKWSRDCDSWTSAYLAADAPPAVFK